MKKRQAAWRLLSILLLALAATGCSHPSPDLAEQRWHNAVMDWDEMYSHVEVPEEPLSLEMAVELALCQNLEILLQVHQRDVQNEVAFAERLKMLPSLTIDGTISERSNSPGTVSQVGTGGSSTPLVSQERRVHRNGLSLAISLIDFGLSFYRSRQEENRGRILDQQQLRIRQNLVKSVTEAYWKAVVAKYAKESAKQLIGKAERRQALLQKRTAKGTVSRIAGLQNEQTLIEMQIKLNAFSAEYDKARAELANFMGFPHGACFELAGTDLLPIHSLELEICELEQEALLSRPELFEQDLQERVAADEVRTAFIQMFPNARLFGETIQDTDRFLIESSWFNVGIQATWDLLRLPSQYRNYLSTKHQVSLVGMTRLSLSVGIMTQVRLAYLTLSDTQSQYQLARDLFRSKSQLLDAAEKEKELGAFSEADIHNLEVDTLISQVNAMRAYADLQIALEQLSNAVGRPLKYSAAAQERCDLEAEFVLVPSQETASVPDPKESTSL